MELTALWSHTWICNNNNERCQLVTSTMSIIVPGQSVTDHYTRQRILSVNSSMCRRRWPFKMRTSSFEKSQTRFCHVISEVLHSTTIRDRCAYSKIFQGGKSIVS